jgi:hypothetical protein
VLQTRDYRFDKCKEQLSNTQHIPR